jgi:hypothetical protein
VRHCGCHPTCWRLPPHVSEAAVLCMRAATPCPWCAGCPPPRSRRAARGASAPHSEALDLVATAASGRLLNRRAAQDVAEYLDVARRPDDVAPEEWAARVRARVLAGVPGAGVLDVEPMDPEDGGWEPAVALAAFALVTGVAAVAVAGALSGEATGVSFGDNDNSAICDEMMASLGSTRSQDYSQCVSDLF